jgi:hypothetical protein
MGLSDEETAIGPPTDDTPEQKAALAIADTVEDSGGGDWPFVDPKDLANSLRQRIKNPNKINQAGTPSCAPAAIAVSLASSKPRLYAEIVSNLYMYGVAGSRLDYA